MQANSNFIGLKNDKLVLSFRFDPKIIAAVKSIDGRLWNAKDKQWEIPKENIGEALAILIPFGFIANLDVLRLKRESEVFDEEIAAIKLADAPYKGTLPLFGFQNKGASFLRQMPSALLADVPGLGKSIQTLAGTEDDMQILIFCPATLKYSWETEIKKWLPNATSIVIEGTKAERGEQWIYAKKGIMKGGVRSSFKYVIANYELLIHDFPHLSDHEWDTIACDEATRISNPDAASVKNLKLLKSKKRIALTGTPISNKPDDIWSILDWMIPRYLGTYSQFKAKYCNLEEEWGQGRTYERITGYKNLEELKKKVDRFMLRRTKEEVFPDFPKKTVENIIFGLSETERKLYTSIKEQLIEEIKMLSALDTSTLAIIPVKMLRLKQCTGHTRLVDAAGKGSSTKLETLKTMLEPIFASGEKAIIFTQFSQMLHIMAAELQQFNPLVIYGDVDNADRMKRVKEFNDDPNPRIIIMTEAGAYGLNMQSASYVFHYDAPWSIAKLQQREDRAHRIGQKKAVTVYNLIAKDTIDEYVMKILHKKNKVSVDILQDAERLGDAGLSEEDIKNILRL